MFVQVIPENYEGHPILLEGVEVGCPREKKCDPNPCHSGGHCTDLWRDFSCTCERPYLGHTCQYSKLILFLVQFFLNMYSL